MDVLKGALAAGLVLVALDGLWLGVFARRWTQKQLGHLMRNPIAWPPAAAFYLLYAAAMGFFAVEPALATADWTMALGRGLFLGLAAYGTYDLTNWSTLKDWPARFSIVDMIWGALVTGLSAAGAVAILGLL